MSLQLLLLLLLHSLWMTLQLGHWILSLLLPLPYPATANCHPAAWPVMLGK